MNEFNNDREIFDYDKYIESSKKKKTSGASFLKQLGKAVKNLLKLLLLTSMKRLANLLKLKKLQLRKLRRKRRRL